MRLFMLTRPVISAATRCTRCVTDLLQNKGAANL